MTSRPQISPLQIDNTMTDLCTITKSLSLEETYTLADRARRKSSDKLVREDLRLKLGHTNVLDSLLKDIARRSPPPSPTQSCSRPVSSPMKRQSSGNSITWATQTVTKVHGVDDYGFAYEDDGEEDMESLSLCRTKSRKPER
ncbi:uncharacterized protein AB675_3828 [Cyphellophora attinorum]|uniref:Uncharacterized protein n=1 Tax=Cyphellophora attinorum TaxID=1664694 RepID=A0A0N0NHU0_9EURO|nr:uncharacterized protein AB675_3828 [Phialophora attinorum]KPI34958.1 hypothetical protein AB675_3828 [Phialophora attinorum]